VSSISARVGVVVATALCMIAASTPAWAGIKGTYTGSTEQVTTASWGAAGATTSGSPTTGQPFVISWPAFTIGGASQYFKMVNTGSLNLSGQTYAATDSGGSLTVTLTACVGASWNTSTGNCGGSQVALDTSGGGSTTDSTAIASGASLSVRAQTSGVISIGSFTTSVTVTTDRTDIRAATTTNS
jgi:hypothetical protein